jgi:hypothetical protein
MKKLLILLAVVSAITANLYSDKWDDIYENKYSIPTEFLAEKQYEIFQQYMELCIETAQKELNEADEKKYKTKQKEALEKRIEQLCSELYEVKYPINTELDIDKEDYEQEMNPCISDAVKELNELDKETNKTQITALEKQIERLLAALYKKIYPIASESCIKNAQEELSFLKDLLTESKKIIVELKEEKTPTEELEKQTKESEKRLNALKQRVSQLKKSSKKSQKKIEARKKKKLSKKKLSKKKIEDYDVYYAEKYSVEDDLYIEIDNDEHYITTRPIKKLIEKAKTELKPLDAQSAKAKALQRRINFLIVTCSKRDETLGEKNGAVICENPYSYIWGNYYRYYQTLYRNPSYIGKAKKELSKITCTCEESKCRLDEKPIKCTCGKTHSDARTEALKKRIKILKKRRRAKKRSRKREAK